MQTRLPKRDIVLLGVGHTNAHVLKMWRMKPIRNARLTCISNFPIATYSGMMPGVLAQQYEVEDMEIDLERLCVANGSRLVVGDVCGIDRERQVVLFNDRPELRYDLLSIGIGSVAAFDGVRENPRLVMIKPMQSFLARLEQAYRNALERKVDPIQVAIVGGGIGGVEVAFGMFPYLEKYFPGQDVAVRLINSGQRLASSVTDKTERRIADELQQRGVELSLGHRVIAVNEGQLVLDNEAILEADVIVWATSATAPPLLEKLPLEKDPRGFLLTRDTLQTVDDDRIFAVGDTGTLRENPTVKAGVYAVRQGPVLWDNLKRSLNQQQLRAYIPQRDFLKLVNLADGRAIAEYKGMTFKAGWCWRLKDRIDRKFMAMYQKYEPMEMSGSSSPDDEAEMRCAGCGGKVGGSILSRTLQRLDVGRNEHVVLGLDRPDDAAVVQLPDGKPFSWTVDFFSSPLDDPYFTGRIAALNSLSDIFAMGDEPITALALITIPVGTPKQQEQLLYELLSGAIEEFKKCGTVLVGGHTIEGPQIAVGFSIVGKQGPRVLKTEIQAGDRLILSKRIGSGVLLAAHMQAQCRAEWATEMRTTMLQSNAVALPLLSRSGVHALTDVTGFGLAGHLLELLRGSDLSARIQLDQVPLYSGFMDLAKAGIESTLAPANRDAEQKMHIPESLRTQPPVSALFDPQTCGGLMLAAPPESVEDVLDELHRGGHSDACVIGEFVAEDRPGVKIELS